MFYQELYAELGKLFYHVAAVDGKVQPAEKISLHTLIDNTWKPLEDSRDQFDTDQSALIEFSFDFEESEGVGQDAILSFEAFYKENKARFTPALISSIIETCKAIALAYRGQNKAEKAVLKKINEIFKDR